MLVFRKFCVDTKWMIPNGFLLKALEQLRNFVWDQHQISLLILCEFKQINKLPFPLKSSKNHRLSDYFRGNRS